MYRSLITYRICHTSFYQLKGKTKQELEFVSKTSVLISSPGLWNCERLFQLPPSQCFIILNMNTLKNGITWSCSLIAQISEWCRWWFKLLQLLKFNKDHCFESWTKAISNHSQQSFSLVFTTTSKFVHHQNAVDLCLGKENNGNRL